MFVITVVTLIMAIIIWSVQIDRRINHVNFECSKLEHNYHRRQELLNWNKRKEKYIHIKLE